MSRPVAFVTGAAGGIGSAVVRRLSDDGFRVVATDAAAGPAAFPYPMPDVGDLERVAEGRPDIITQVVDVRDLAGLNSAVADTLERWGRLDVVVAAAAVIDGGTPLWEASGDSMALLWEVDVVGVWNAICATVPAMLAGPDPSNCRVIAIGSAAGTHGLFRLGGYTMAKHAVVGLMKGLAADLVGTGITAVTVSPGSTRTAMLDQTALLYPGTTTCDLASHQLIRRVIEPNEMASVVAFCASREGGILNGGVVHADGGFSA